jgi:hypothetical protein
VSFLTHYVPINTNLIRTIPLSRLISTEIRLAAALPIR